MAFPPRGRQAFKNLWVAGSGFLKFVSLRGFLFDRPAKTTSNGRRGLLTKENQSGERKG